MLLRLEVKGDFRFRTIGQCHIAVVVKKVVNDTTDYVLVRNSPDRILNDAVMKAFKDIVLNSFTKTVPCNDFSEHLPFGVRGPSRINNSDERGFLMYVVNRFADAFEFFVYPIAVGMVCLV